MTGTKFRLEVQPIIPECLLGLVEVANDLLYSWDRDVRRLFIRLNPKLWDACGHNPKVFLRRVSQQRLLDAAEDRNYMEDYHRTLSAYNSYHREGLKPNLEKYLNPKEDTIAYFCAEFGFHESIPIYSGGLGILAGDHCKAASDLGIPFVAIGLLYRKSYFSQTIDIHGHQIAHYSSINFDDLPMEHARDIHGNGIFVHIDLPGRPVTLKVWKVKAGHISLYLLDSDLEQNNEEDRSITFQLYGGDLHTRIQQEIVLGIGGVRALRALNIYPSVWHINEGHAAFQILERCRERVEQSLEFDSALELVANGTVFTTHTPVSAGHDIFDYEMVSSYFSDFSGQLGIGMDEFQNLGTSPSNPDGFNMTTLALRGSRFRNGVSRIHGSVASEMEGHVWPQISPESNPISYVTNGVHVPTFLARAWANLFDMQFGRKWRNELLNADYWTCIDDIPDHSYWSLHQSLKSNLLEVVRHRVTHQGRRNGCNTAQINRMIRYLSPEDADILVLGFARRFATYKRATLLFSDPERLAKLLNDPQRPVLIIFSGKAHPNDEPGQHLIKVIHDYSRCPEFEGKIIFLEDYNMTLARDLVAGVDVWLNTPTYPLEASGTSGEKAGINGVINLSVLDGWWGEGYNGENGWAITPHGPQFEEDYRNQEEAKDLLEILENQVIPLYFERDTLGFSAPWVQMSKASMKSIIPHFNAQRMVVDYVKNFYSPAIQQRKKLIVNEGAPARSLVDWKKKCASTWPKITLRRDTNIPQKIKSGENLSITVLVQLHDLEPNDVIVECLVGKITETNDFVVYDSYQLTPSEKNEQGDTLFYIALNTELSGLQYYKIRIFPYHELLSHRFETGFMTWLEEKDSE